MGAIGLMPFRCTLGNTGDPTTVPDQVAHLQTEFGIARVVLVGDRGMLTEAQLRNAAGASRAGVDFRLAESGHPRPDRERDAPALLV